MIPNESPPVDWNARIALARSILNHRDPSEHAADMARYALMGAGIDTIILLDADQ